MGEETIQFKKELEKVIRDMAGDVTETRIAQATIIADVKNVHRDVKKINGRLGTVEEKTDSLESTRDKNIASKKTTAKWVSGIVVAIGILFGVLRLWGCASPCEPGYETLYEQPDTVQVEIMCER